MTRTILLVDAHAESREVYGTVLKCAGWNVVEAVDVSEGMRMAQREHPEAIVTELLLPGVDGLGLMGALGADPSTREIPVLILTSDDEPRHMAEALGCSSYLVKPCPPVLLLKEVQRYASAPRIRAAAPTALPA